MTPQERAALDLAKKWKAGASTQGVKPVVGADGAIRFLFGATQPSMVCAVLQVCDVELQPGEQVNSLHLGDTARWTQPLQFSPLFCDFYHITQNVKGLKLPTGRIELAESSMRSTFHYSERVFLI